MGYIIQDSFRILKEELPSTFDYRDIKDNDEEVRAFILTNMLDKSFVSINNNYYHNVNFYDNKNHEEYRAFEEGYLYMLPYNEKLEVGRNINAFCIGKELTAIKVTDRGLFIETDDRLGNIVTKFYSNEKLKEITNAGISCASIDYIEENISNLGIKPNAIVNASKEGSVMHFQIYNGDRLIDQNIVNLNSPYECAYKTYYEYMNDNLFYNDPIETYPSNKRI